LLLGLSVPVFAHNEATLNGCVTLNPDVPILGSGSNFANGVESPTPHPACDDCN